MGMRHKPLSRRLGWVLVLMGLLVLGLAPISTAAGKTGAPWWKGNLHTHSFWSDGDDFPEMVAQWYQAHGYHFLALTDHNVLSQGQRWTTVSDGRRAAFEKYFARFGGRWVETRQDQEGNTQVRLKPLSEFRCLFEQPGNFLLIQSEEITDKAHLNAINTVELIPPQGGASIPAILQNNIDAVRAQQEKTGQSMLVTINHPNFQWALTAEDLTGLQGAQFFELYNAHGYVNNDGNDVYASTERVWDIVLTRQLAELDGPVMYTVATDDTHNYHTFNPRAANPGQAWVVVRAYQLTPEALINAMNEGDFYCSTGVALDDIAFENNVLTVQVAPQDNVTYTTQFIGTRKGYDPTSRPVTDAEGETIRATRRYSDDIGVVLAEVQGLTARYEIQGDEIYVRAKIISSRKNKNSHVPDEYEAAWTQPIVVK